MDAERVALALPKPVAIVATVAALAAVVGIAHRLDRAYSRWLTEMSPLTKPRARFVQLLNGYRVRRDDASDVAQLMNELWAEIDLARSLRG